MSFSETLVGDMNEPVELNCLLPHVDGSGA